MGKMDNAVAECGFGRGRQVAFPGRHSLGTFSFSENPEVNDSHEYASV
jgi:hypothetical protein